MANCTECKRYVSCPCNLINNYCPSCYSKNFVRPMEKAFIANPNHPTSEIDTFLNTNRKISKEEKLRRINEIIDRQIQKNIENEAEL